MKRKVCIVLSVLMLLVASGCKPKSETKIENNISIQETTERPSTAVVTTEKPTEALNEQPEKYLGISFDELKKVFGDNYSEVEVLESGRTKYVTFPKSNQLEFGIDANTQKVLYIMIHDCSQSITLYESFKSDMTGKDVMSQKGNCEISDDYLQIDNSHNINVKYNNGIILTYKWAGDNYMSTHAQSVSMCNQNIIQNTANAVNEPEEQNSSGSSENQNKLSDDECMKELTENNWKLSKVFENGKEINPLNAYGDFILTTGTKLVFNNDHTFTCSLGFYGCSGTFSVDNGVIKAHTDTKFTGAGNKSVDFDQTLEFDYENKTVAIENDGYLNLFEAK